MGQGTHNIVQAFICALTYSIVACTYYNDGDALVIFCGCRIIFSKELTSTTQQKTVHITPNKAEFLQTMISHHSEDYEVFVDDL